MTSCSCWWQAACEHAPSSECGLLAGKHELVSFMQRCVVMTHQAHSTHARKCAIVITICQIAHYKMRHTMKSLLNFARCIFPGGAPTHRRRHFNRKGATPGAWLQLKMAVTVTTHHQPRGQQQHRIIQTRHDYGHIKPQKKFGRLNETQSLAVEFLCHQAAR